MDHLDLFNPKTYEFMDGLFKEYLEGEEPVFRGKRVHIGTDEYSNKDPKVVEKFREFTDRYIRYVESFGKQACVWGALTHAKGETPVTGIEQSASLRIRRRRSIKSLPSNRVMTVTVSLASSSQSVTSN